MIKVKVVSAEPSLESVPDFVSQSLIDRINRQFVTPENYDANIVFTIAEDYDYLIIFKYLNKLKVNVDKSHVFGFIIDPPSLYDDHFYTILGQSCKAVYTCANKKYYKNNGNYISAPSVMFYHLAGDSAFYRNNQDFAKAKKLSICTSNSGGSKMYDFRKELVYKILESDLDCDIYGRGWELNDPRYKGGPENKADALLPYEYSIAIENSIYDSYVSEKLFDCFLCNTIPIYYGSPTAETIYNPRSFLILPYINDMDRLISWLKDLTKAPSGSNLRYKNAVLQSKERYFKQYNLYDLIKQMIYNQ
jgi:hypothetical protein